MTSSNGLEVGSITMFVFTIFIQVCVLLKTSKQQLSSTAGQTAVFIGHVPMWSNSGTHVTSLYKLWTPLDLKSYLRPWFSTTYIFKTVSNLFFQFKYNNILASDLFPSCVEKSLLTVLRWFCRATHKVVYWVPWAPLQGAYLPEKTYRHARISLLSHTYHSDYFFVKTVQKLPSWVIFTIQFTFDLSTF